MDRHHPTIRRAVAQRSQGVSPRPGAPARKDVNWFRGLLERSLEGHLSCTKIDAIPGDPSRFLGIIVSPAFEGMEDYERQEIVWDRVLKTIDWSDLWRIEFLFTNTPAEMAAFAEADANEPTAEKAVNRS